MANDVLDWDELSDDDKQRTLELMSELNRIFDRYYLNSKEEKVCEDSILDE